MTLELPDYATGLLEQELALLHRIRNRQELGERAFLLVTDDLDLVADALITLGRFRRQRWLDVLEGTGARTIRARVRRAIRWRP